MMAQRRIFSWIFSLSLLLALGCSKQPDEIGTNLQPGSELITFHYDTTLVIDAYAVREDSIRTDETSQSLLGSYWDPYFGITRASIYTQLRLSSSGHSFGTNPVVDSVVLSLAYNGAYGDSSALQTITVYELADTLGFDEDYYSNSVISVEPSVLATKTFIARPYDSVLVDTVKKAPHFTVKITDQAFMDKIITAAPSDLVDNSSFTKYIKGILIDAGPAAAPNLGSVMFISTESTLTHMMVYYHNDADTLSFQLDINGYCARFNHYDHNDYLEADPLLRQQIIDKNYSLGADRLYLQAMGGIRTDIRFDPEVISGLRNKGYAINEARLVVTDLDKTSKYDPPAKIVLVQVDTADAISYLEDQYEGDTYFGGSYLNNGTYSFRISHYVQSLINGDIDPTTHLTFYATSSAVRGNRLIFCGANPGDPSLSASRLQVQVLFSKAP